MSEREDLACDPFLLTKPEQIEAARDLMREVRDILQCPQDENFIDYCKTLAKRLFCPCGRNLVRSYCRFCSHNREQQKDPQT